MPAKTRVGLLIRRRRLALGLTQKQVSDKTGYEQTYLSRIELGKIQRPRKDVLLALARALDMPHEDLFRAIDWVIPAGEGNVETPGEEVRSAHDTRAVTVTVAGWVPADSFRWTAEDGETSVELLPWQLKCARSPVALVVTGACMEAIGIFAGDRVIVDRDPDRRPRDRELVVIRLGDSYSLKRWCEAGDRIELRDGAENVVAEVLPSDDLDLYGTYVTYIPGNR